MKMTELARRIGERPAPAGFENAVVALSHAVGLLTTPIDFAALAALGHVAGHAALDLTSRP
jgi:hypothetical protein